MPNKPYSIFNLGLDAAMNRSMSLLAYQPEDTTTPVGALAMVIPSSLRAEDVTAGEIPQTLFYAKQSFADTVSGMRQGFDPVDGLYKWIIGNSTNSVDFNVTSSGVLTITGAITATSGAIGGFDIGTDYIRDVANSFGLASTVTAGDDVRFWAGDTFTNRATAPFRITEAGVIVATSATITGTITTSALTATGGTIAAFTIAAATIAATNLTLTSGAANVANISVGTGSTLGGMNAGNASGDIAFWAGDTYANRATAAFRVTLGGAVTMTSATITGSTIGDLQTFTSNGTWTKPAGAQLVLVTCIGAGGGGGGGIVADAGGSGGGGGAYIQKVFKASDFAATVSVTVGTGGTGGLGGPNNGVAGGSSSFGSHLVVFGGGGGALGALTNSGGGGGGWAGVGAVGGVAGASSLGGSTATTAGTNGLSGQGAGGVTAAAGRAAEYGGGGGGGEGSTNSGGGSLFGAPGGGGGGSVAGAGAAGGNIQSYSSGGGGAGGSGGNPGSNGTAGTAGDIGTGGGGGGAGSGGGNGGTGGAGGAPGGGGGGGGGVSGIGGAGGRGEVRVYTI